MQALWWSCLPSQSNVRALASIKHEKSGEAEFRLAAFQSCSLLGVFLRRLVDRMCPGTFRLLGDDRIGLHRQQDVDGAVEIGRIQIAGAHLRAFDQLGDFTHHALLMFFGLRARGVIVQHDLGRSIRVLNINTVLSA